MSAIGYVACSACVNPMHASLTAESTDGLYGWHGTALRWHPTKCMTEGDAHLVKVRKRDGRLVELKRDGQIVEIVEPKTEADALQAGATANEATYVAEKVANLQKVKNTMVETFVEHRDAELKTTQDPPDAATIMQTPAITEILRTVPRQEGFHFYTEEGQPTGLIATSLLDFIEKVREVESCSVHFHFTRQDFEKWIRDVIGDIDLVTTINTIPRYTDGEALRNEICQIVQVRLKELQKFAS